MCTVLTEKIYLAKYYFELNKFLGNGIENFVRQIFSESINTVKKFITSQNCSLIGMFFLYPGDIWAQYKFFDSDTMSRNLCEIKMLNCYTDNRHITIICRQLRNN